MTRRKILVADLLCGAGGSSTGAARALAELGLEMDLVCVNHWPTAIETHRRNHPEARARQERRGDARRSAAARPHRMDQEGCYMSVEFMVGDCRTVLASLPAQSVNCCVTSPPYFGLRDYGVDGQIGLEQTPQAYVDELVSVFREVKRVLRDDGTLWLNLGDSYNAHPGQRKTTDAAGPKQMSNRGAPGAPSRHVSELKPKDLIGIPWRVAFALQADGWYLRQDIIWAKPNPMPESVRDRCTKAHEYVFLLSKSERYLFDAEAISEPLAPSSVERLSQPNIAKQSGSARVPGKTNGNMKAVGPRFGGNKYGDHEAEAHRTKSGNEWTGSDSGRRNKRSVWTVATQPFSEAHFATMAPELARTCIMAGCPLGGTVLDPFGGAGTTGLVADQLQRTQS